MSNLNKAQNDFKDAINNLKQNIRLFNEGQTSAYRVVAVQLRVLLCDSDKRKDLSLMPRLFGDVKFHPLRGALPKELLEKITFMMPARVSFDGKSGAKIEALFDYSKNGVPLKEWLAQSLFSKDVTIYKFIRSVADKESVHSDEDYNDALRLTKSVHFPKEDICSKFIVAIGEYLLSIIG
jgi:hypothetical protein